MELFVVWMVYANGSLMGWDELMRWDGYASACVEAGKEAGVAVKREGRGGTWGGRRRRSVLDETGL